MAITDDLINDSIDRWLAAVDPGGFFEVNERIQVGENCLASDSNSGTLLLGLPKDKFCSNMNVGHRVFWLPDRFPPGQSVKMASSRIGNQPDCKPGLFDAIRTLACRFQRESQFLVTHESTSTHPFAIRSAALFDLPLVEFRPMPRDVDSTWFQKKLSHDEKSVCYYDTHFDQWNDGFQVDQFMMTLSRDVRLLSVRKNGNIFRGAMNRLKNIDTMSRTFILFDPTISSKSALKELVNAGAVPWVLLPDSSSEFQVETKCGYKSLKQLSRETNLREYLLHWTRRRKGPWPHQSTEQYLDDLILGRSSANHSRSAALARILATGKLAASNDFVRDNTPVVCFSELTVDMLQEMRTFRTHLSRWDFETAGIAIKRNVLSRIDARPVIYGDDVCWNQLPASDQPYFQKCDVESIDWSIEKEWRVIGNVDLSRIGTDDAFVFVENAEEAEWVAPLSRWPVVVLN